MRTLIRQSELRPTDLVVEIGAGTGVLTAALAAFTREVHAIEVDPYLVAGLHARFASQRNVHVRGEDFFDARLPDAPYAVFANVPFNRTADVVRRLTTAPLPPEDAYLVVQFEAAARFAGRPYAPESVASLSLHPWWHLEIVHWFRRTDFSPPPAVDAVLLHLARRPRPLIADAERPAYLRFLEGAFGAGDVARGLRARFKPREVRLFAERLRFDPGGAPSELSFRQWLTLYRQGRGEAAAVAPSRPRDNT